MASFAMEEYLGGGALEGLAPRLAAGGWGDVPTLKLMSSQDMDAMHLTPKHKVALELRSYLHGRSLMEYADRLEASGKPLAELTALSATALSSQFGMRRGHTARFVDGTAPPPARQRSCRLLPPELRRSPLPELAAQLDESSLIGSCKKEEVAISEGYVFKGIVAAEAADARLCGCVQAAPVVEDVAPYSAVEGVSVQRLAPEYRVGARRLVTAKAPPMKASELWRDRPVVLLCVRRPGCIMCRAEAHNLYSQKPVFDALGFQLIAVLHEDLESEVGDFWPRYWGGAVILDRAMDFFRALGGGQLLRDKFITGFLLNPRAIANYRRAKATGLKQNSRGEGVIKGGLFVIGSGRRGIAYQFIERNFGDWAPISEVIEVCTQLQMLHTI